MEKLVGAGQLLGLSDLLVDKRLTGLDAQIGLSKALSVPPEAIRVSEHIEDVLLPPRPAVFCQITAIDGGDFHTHLSPHEDFTVALPTIPLVVEFCRTLQCRCLVGDETVDPFAFYLVDMHGGCRHVGVDPKAADAGQYVLSHRSNGPS